MTNLEIVVRESGIDAEDGIVLTSKFSDYESVAREWEQKAKQILVTSETQTTEIEMAKVAKKKFAEMRIEIEKTRKSLKEQSLRKGQAIDSIAKYLQSLIAPIEEHLRLQADFVKIKQEKDAEELRIKLEKEAEEKRKIEEAKKQTMYQRQLLLAPYAEYGTCEITIETTEEEYQLIFNNLVEAKKQKQEQIEKEREAMAQQLKEREAQLAKEREESQKKLEDEREKARQEREAQLAKQKELEKMIKKCPNCGYDITSMIS